MNRTIVAAGLAIALVMASLPLSHAAGERDGVTFDSADEVSRETREVGSSTLRPVSLSELKRPSWSIRYPRTGMGHRTT